MAAFGCLSFLGCAVKPVQTETQRLDVNLEPIRAVVEDGDWLVIRGVTGPDDFISSVTNMPFSHAAIYDAEKDEVIEADARGVSSSPLPEFLLTAYRIWVVKPIWATEKNRHAAALRARSRIGRPYNFTGLIGLSLPDSYYCTQLVMDAWEPFIDKRGGNPIPLVVSPGRLHHWGRVVYDSFGLEKKL
ncbi:MAG: hypothetical protein LBT62_01230 [Deltaproteobacteria bacterium]|nr:hypothetical protein [Deltaproteobacteria bacterium]